jgi:hypothetical protein
MDANDAGKLRPRLYLKPEGGRRGIKREDLGGMPLVDLAGIGQGVNGLILPQPFHRGHRGFEGIEIPGTDLFSAESRRDEKNEEG